jgi:hypothetical protein
VVLVSFVVKIEIYFTNVASSTAAFSFTSANFWVLTDDQSDPSSR